MIFPHPKNKAIRLKGEALKRLYESVLKRDNYTCVNPDCKKDTPLDRAPHHIRYKSQQGSDVAENLAWLCMGCHDAVHKHNISQDFLFEYQKTLGG